MSPINKSLINPMVDNGVNNDGFCEKDSPGSKYIVGQNDSNLPIHPITFVEALGSSNGSLQNNEDLLGKVQNVPVMFKKNVDSNDIEPDTPFSYTPSHVSYAKGANLVEQDSVDGKQENDYMPCRKPSVISNGISSGGGSTKDKLKGKLKIQSLMDPVLKKNFPLHENSSNVEKCCHAFLCPPSGMVGYILTSALLLTFIWASMASMTKEQALPGGTLFSLFVLVVFAEFGGRLVAKIKLPPLLGMLLVGILLRSVPGLDVIGNSIAPAWSSGLRSVALVVILIRAGLGLDPAALKKLSFVVLRLAALPCLTETFVVAVVCRFLLNFPWTWGIMLGFILAAVSPAVVVPCLLKLNEEGYGVDKGIPTLVIAAASIDDVIAISGFGVLLGLNFSSGSAAYHAMKGPLEVVIGLGFGIIVGVLMWYLPYKREKNAVQLRVILLFSAGLVSIFGSKAIGFGGAGALACLCVAFFAAIGWKSRTMSSEGAQVKDYFQGFWTFFQPMLFGLIGTEIQIGALEPATIGWGLLTLCIGLSFRVIVSFIAVLGGDFNFKERIFIALAWLPKATVQAAIGSTALDYAREADGDPNNESPEEILGKQVLTIAVLVILITAPIGAIAIMQTAPRLLNKTPSESKNSEP